MPEVEAPEALKVSITFTLAADRNQIADLVETVAREIRDEDRQGSGYVRGPRGRPIGHWEIYS